MKKKWIVSASVALALGALATVTVAERAGKMRGPWEPMSMIPEHLDLTDEQKEQFKELRKGHMEAMREQREVVMKILTEEQQQTLKEMRAKRRKFFGQRGSGGKESVRHATRRQGRVFKAGSDRRAKGTAQGIARRAPCRDTRNAPKAPHGLGKRLER